MKLGGTLVCLDQAGDLAIEAFSLPVRNVARAENSRLFCPGSILQTRTRCVAASGVRDDATHLGILCVQLRLRSNVFGFDRRPYGPRGLAGTRAPSPVMPLAICSERLGWRARTSLLDARRSPKSASARAGSCCWASASSIAGSRWPPSACSSTRSSRAANDAKPIRCGPHCASYCRVGSSPRMSVAQAPVGSIEGTVTTAIGGGLAGVVVTARKTA